MFTLSISFGPSGTIIAAMFKERAKAETALRSIKQGAEDFLCVEDDYGQHIELRKMTVNGYWIEDVVLAGDAAGERAILNQKAQIKANNKAGQDPLLKLAAGGMAMNHPGAPNGQRRAF